jgi:NitT/TauT family transport system ATP-binding protein
MTAKLRDATSCVSSPMIDVRNVSKTFLTNQGSVVVIENVSLQVSAGRFATVVGPSGCGKSTLLMILSGLIRPTTGEVKIAGEVVTKPRPERIGMVFQDPTLLPWRTALGNVEFPLMLSGVDREQCSLRSRELLELVGLENCADNFPHELSGGMRQRIGIARGLALDPTILLMDEPFSALDEQNRTKLGGELLRIWEKTKKTIFFVTHSLIEAVYLSDVIFVMGQQRGRILEVVEVEIPRPRPIEVIGTAEFGRIRNHIWQLVAGGTK